MSGAALMKLPKVDPATVKKAKEFVMTWGPAIAGTLRELLDKVFGNKRLKEEIQRLEGELNVAVGHINALIAENESQAEEIELLISELEQLRSKLRLTKVMLFVAAGVIVILTVVLSK